MAPCGSEPLQAPLEGPSGQGLAAWAYPTAQPEAGQPGGTGAVPAPGVGHLHGDGRWARGWARLSDTHSLVGLWGTGDQPCCGVAGAGADGPRG